MNEYSDLLVILKTDWASGSNQNSLLSLGLPSVRAEQICKITHRMLPPVPLLTVTIVRQRLN